MPSRDGMAIRRERIQTVTKLILSMIAKSENDEIDLSRAMGLLEYEIGARPERLKEYLKTGERAGYFVIDEANGKILSMKKVRSDD
jgi:hypothetical protein